MENKTDFKPYIPADKIVPEFVISTEPTDGGIMLEHGDTARKYTVYAIETDGRMIVGDVTV